MIKSNFTNIDQFTQEDIEKFTKRFNSCEETDKGCILWTENLFDYGTFYTVGRKTSMNAHRFSYLLFNGPLKQNEIIRHICDIPNCVNPGHLIKGTDKDNQIDRRERNFIHYAPKDFTQQILSEIISLKEQNMQDNEITNILGGKHKPPKTWIKFLINTINSEIYGKKEAKEAKEKARKIAFSIYTSKDTHDWFEQKAKKAGYKKTPFLVHLLKQIKEHNLLDDILNPK